MDAAATEQEAGKRVRWSLIYAVFLLTIVNAFNYMDRMVLAVLAEPIKIDLDLSDAELGLLTGFAFVAVYAVVGLPLARLADRIGRRWVLAGSLAVWSAMTAISGSARNFTELALARAGVGVGEAGGMPSSHALIAEMYPPEKRAVPISIMTAGACIGIAAGLGLGGWVAGTYGWRAAFLIVGLPGLLLALIVALTLPEPKRAAPADDAAPRPPMIASVRKLLSIKTYRWLVATHPFYTFITAGLIGWLPPFYIRSHGMTVEAVGAFFGLAYGFGMVMGGIVGALVLQRVSKGRVEIIIRYAGWLMLLAFPLFAGAMFVPSQWISLLLITLFGMTTGAAGAPMIAGQQGVIDSGNRALGSAVSVFFSGYLGAGLGPVLIGVASDSLAPIYGAEALRLSLLCASLAIIPPGLFMLKASRHYAADATTSSGQGG
ncbi:MAG: major facilitator superfamily 1 [Sphingomonas bacterium]|uniref:spinster family MFS transporter n=1 Tax=Sphingomonas bacterium TaxID=1895847 RepID=UPI00262BEFC1|nr:MFS transporter [Sphingomonas bacterium]MDB5696431.1 major facilitator superfamily 1 [Sphingomonas bacterium]